MRRIQARGIRAGIALLVEVGIETSLEQRRVEQSSCQRGAKNGVVEVIGRGSQASLDASYKSFNMSGLEAVPRCGSEVGRGLVRVPAGSCEVANKTTDRNSWRPWQKFEGRPPKFRLQR